MHYSGPAPDSVHLLQSVRRPTEDAARTRAQRSLFDGLHPHRTWKLKAECCCPTASPTKNPTHAQTSCETMPTGPSTVREKVILDSKPINSCPAQRAPPQRRSWASRRCVCLANANIPLRELLTSACVHGLWRGRVPCNPAELKRSINNVNLETRSGSETQSVMACKHAG